MTMHKQSKWVSASKIKELQINKEAENLLLAKGSLTNRLRQIAKQQVTIKLIKTGFALLLENDVLKFLQLAKPDNCFFREVIISVDAIPVIVAKSWFSKVTYNSNKDIWDNLATKALGDYLFSRSDINRVCMLLTANPYIRDLSFESKNLLLNDKILTRRSKFLLANNPIVVTEFFLPRIWQLIGGNN